ncbi:hypothetical protein [Leifsonia xyli]|uniref:hypothetical protein n=1 Tax=Leifsonia xyli TaxID=1575 RepID=UPI003D66B971
MRQAAGGRHPDDGPPRLRVARDHIRFVGGIAEGQLRPAAEHDDLAVESRRRGVARGRDVDAVLRQRDGRRGREPERHQMPPGQQRHGTASGGPGHVLRRRAGHDDQVGGGVVAEVRAHPGPGQELHQLPVAGRGVGAGEHGDDRALAVAADRRDAEPFERAVDEGEDRASGDVREVRLEVSPGGQ